MPWERYVVCKTDMINAYKILSGSNTGRNELRDLGLDSRKILKQISKRLGKGVDWILHRIRIIRGFS
jgi:hypothetical protein